MAFDGVDHRGASLIYPIAYHPKAPLLATVMRSGLTIAYLHARRANRLVLCTSYPYNFQSPATQRALPEILDSTSYRRITEGYRVIGPGVTHLAGQFHVTVFPRFDSTVSARLVASRSYASTAWQLTSNEITITVAAGHGFTAGQMVTFDTVTAAGDVSTAVAVASVTSTSVKIPKAAADVGLTTEAGTITATDTGTAATLGLSSVRPRGFGGFSPFDSISTRRLDMSLAITNCTAGYLHNVYLEAKCIDDPTSQAVEYAPRAVIVWTEVRDS